MGRIARLRERARALRTQTMTVWYAARDPRLPWPVRLVALAVAAYALSPIDLIPDVIPVLGLLDDIVLVPLGLALVVKLTPPAILADARAKAELAGRGPRSLAAAVVIVGVWLALAWLAVRWWLSRPGG